MRAQNECVLSRVTRSVKARVGFYVPSLSLFMNARNKRGTRVRDRYLRTRIQISNPTIMQSVDSSGSYVVSVIPPEL